MSRFGRLRSETHAATLAFLRRRTAVFFTFFFPVIIVVIFGVLVQTRPGGGGLFTEPPSYYVPGYLAVVVLFTPLSRVGSEVARHRDGNRFEKLATTPLTRTEWLLAQTAVNVVVIGLAGLLLLFLMVGVTGASIRPSPLLLPFVALGVALFCGVGALIGSLASSQDGVISASNGIALPLLFLSETFVPPTLLPGWLPTWLSPLTYFSRGVRAATTGTGDTLVPFAILAACAALAFVVAARLLPRTD
ncbi:ABC transporter permease [Haloarcula pelagica]|uniref:ABC transporter permease n=1 Tax=Haloarcula pelagica TaxID=3033389 RepID=UPI0024C2371B|nr:ABC transporter permease [Halomicroarcula sp. YJ-61-S]